MFKPGDRITLVMRISGTIFYGDEVDFDQKTKNWKEFYNFSRPFGAFTWEPSY
jgi:hypothetical protein